MTLLINYLQYRLINHLDYAPYILNTCTLRAGLGTAQPPLVLTNHHQNHIHFAYKEFMNLTSFDVLSLDMGFI